MDFCLSVFTKSARMLLWSSSPDVNLFISLYLNMSPSLYFLLDLSLALGSHDQFQASHRSLVQ